MNIPMIPGNNMKLSDHDVRALHVPDWTLKSLEYKKLIRLLSRYMGFFGRRYLRKTRPLTDPERIVRRQQYIRGLLQIARKHPIRTLKNLPDIRPYLRRARPENAWLEPAELLTVANFFETIQETRRNLAPYATELGPLWVVIRTLPRMKSFCREIHRYIRPDGELDESASPELRRISREWRAIRRRIEEQVRGLMGRPEIASALQDTILTQRDRRWVILVRADHKNRLPGLVLGASSSGASVYVEPFEIVELNNQYILLEDERKAEIIRILKRLTSPLRKIKHPTRLYRRVALLDFILGITSWALDYEAHLPVFTDSMEIRIHQARHPLLSERLKKTHRPVIPVDLDLPISKRAMILTGPNAGGKTVTLKTVGLLTLMAQMGLPVTAGEHTRLPVFSHLYADIGDQQDIYHDLSTFASHIQRIVPMITESGERGLYLLDELGTGTDPVEGAALSQAILETLLERSGKVIAVTHLTELKIMALRDPRILSASMEFDVHSLAPTYRLIPNAIGASHALDIARRFGMPESLLQRARTHMDPESRRFYEAVERLENRELQLQQRIREMDALQAERIRELEARIEALERERERLRQERRALERKIRAWWIEREKEWESMVRDIQSAEWRRKLMKQFRQWEREAEEQRHHLQPEEKSYLSIQHDDIKPGMYVRIRGGTSPARVERLVPQSGTVEVIFEGKRMNIPLAWIEQVVRMKEPRTSTEVIASSVKPEERVVNLLGLHIPEAREKLERAIDRAVRAGWPTLKVIHGYRPGRLKKAVLNYLKQHPAIREVEPAPPREGGPGATIVFLRDEHDT